ncbi:MAG: hypothetical protein LBF40_00995 [Deltaproteobacteria bacterium]|nr:hypothetical protein [Deltaproteobacteria bacterium]
MGRGKGKGGAKAPAVSGLLLLDKPSGPTSHDLVDMVRRALSQREVGHLGTLDPLASGLMGLLLGPATKLAPYLSGLPKRYRAEMLLGLATDSLDVLGAPIGDLGGALGSIPKGSPLSAFPPESLVPPGALAIGEDEVRHKLSGFLGEFGQIPPGYSAIKVGGVPSHRLARRGEAPVLAPRRVWAKTLGLISFEPPVAVVECEVSSGFYVRSLARDLGLSLGLPGGCLRALRRLSIGPFDLGRAIAPPLSREAIDGALISPRDALPFLPEYRADSRALSLLRDGRALHGPELDCGQAGLASGLVRVTGPDGELALIGEYVMGLSAEDGTGVTNAPGESPGAPSGPPRGDTGAGAFPARPFLRPRRVLRPAQGAAQHARG